MTDSPLIQIPATFFPTGVYHYFTPEKHGTDVLLPHELAVAQAYGPKRLSDFCTGRYCLRRCTEQYGFSGDILVGTKGMPLLPGHITASLSHSRHLCGAIAAPKDRYASLGLDIETNGRVNKGMWHLLFSDTETAYLNSLSDEQQQQVTTIFFSMKEAFYKMQYPLTNTFLDFHEVEMITDGDRYAAKLLRDAGHFQQGQLFPGSVYHAGEETITLCALPA